MGYYMTVGYAQHQTPLSVAELQALIAAQPWAQQIDDNPIRFFTPGGGTVSFIDEDDEGIGFQRPLISIRLGWGSGPYYKVAIEHWLRFATEHGMSLYCERRIVTVENLPSVLDSTAKADAWVRGMFGTTRPLTEEKGEAQEPAPGPRVVRH